MRLIPTTTPASDTGGTGGQDPRPEGEPSLLGAAAPEVVDSGRKSRRRREPRGDGPRRRFPVGLGVLAVVLGVVLLALTPTVASGLVKTPKDKVGISYGGGPDRGRPLPADRPARLVAVLERVVRPALPVSRRPAELHRLQEHRGGDGDAGLGAGPVEGPRAGRVPGGGLLQAQHRPAPAVPRAARPEVQGLHRRGLGPADPGHVPPADRERPPGGDPPIERRRPLRRRRPPDRHPEPGAGDAEPEAHRRAGRPVLLLARRSSPGATCEDPTFIVKAIEHPRAGGQGLRVEPHLAGPDPDQGERGRSSARRRPRASRPSATPWPRPATTTCCSRPSSRGRSTSG